MGRAPLFRAILNQAFEDDEQLRAYDRSDSFEGNRRALEGLKRIVEQAPGYERFGASWVHANARTFLRRAEAKREAAPRHEDHLFNSSYACGGWVCGSFVFLLWRQLCG